MSTHIEPVYGLTTMHASLRTFGSESPPSGADAAVKAATYAFGLMALGKFILRLPAEVAEDEIPRLRTTLIAVRTCCLVGAFSQLLSGTERFVVPRHPRIGGGDDHLSTVGSPR